MTSRIMRVAASKSLLSILEDRISGELPPTFNNKVDDVVGRFARGPNFTWVLLQPVGDRFNIADKSNNELTGLQKVLFELIGADCRVYDQSRLAAFVCNTTMSV